MRVRTSHRVAEGALDVPGIPRHVRVRVAVWVPDAHERAVCVVSQQAATGMCVEKENDKRACACVRAQGKATHRTVNGMRCMYACVCAYVFACVKEHKENVCVCVCAYVFACVYVC